jgi:hypothetical protein
MIVLPVRHLVVYGHAGINARCRHKPRCRCDPPTSPTARFWAHKERRVAAREYVRLNCSGNMSALTAQNMSTSVVHEWSDRALGETGEPVGRAESSPGPRPPRAAADPFV